ncbi:MAG: DUF5106 domain-containing protein [Alistipes sp.]|nr:DUF5106 domain-containing protein [Alistipes sp.]
MRIRVLYIVLTLLLVVGCGSRPTTKERDKATTERHYVPGTRPLERRIDIGAITSEEEYRHALEHYWDGFDFTIGERVAEYDTLELIYAMADYVTIIPPQGADTLLRNLMHRAEASRPVLDMFATVAEVVLHDPNSPLRNDEYYIPILEVLVTTPLYDEYDRIAPTYDLDIARKNRIGTTATDFVYTLANGRQGRLHTIDARYTIVMFSNPGCPMCREIRSQIEASPLINELRERGDMAIITLYPDEDVDAWREYLAELPATWINAYDKGMTLTKERLYNLNAIPSLYLLDKHKRIIIKDGSNVAAIENAIAIMEAQ